MWETAAAWEKDGIAHGEIRPVIGAVDETFLPQMIKLAHTGLGCLSIPDVLHLGHDLAKGYALAIFGRLRQAKRDLEHAKQCLETLPKNDQAKPAQVAQTPARVVDCATSVHHWQEVGSAWRQHLSNVSRLLHPWRRWSGERLCRGPHGGW